MARPHISAAQSRFCLWLVVQGHALSVSFTEKCPNFRPARAGGQTNLESFAKLVAPRFHSRLVQTASATRSGMGARHKNED
jgi:hypothetical protein